MDIALHRNRIDTRALGLALWWAAISGLVFMFSVYYVTGIQLTDPRCGIEVLLNGTAYQPYVYRVLTVWALHGLVALGIDMPASLLLVTASSSLISVIAFYHLAALFYEHHRAAMAAPLLLVAIVILRASFSYVMIYDMPNLALWTVATVFMIRRRWMTYLLVFVLACLNKETAALLTIGFAAMYLGRLSWRSYVTLGAIQFAIWLIIRLAILAAFAGSPGGAMEQYIPYHIYVLTAMPTVVGVYAVAGIGLLAVVFRRWKDKPLKLRRLFVTLAPIMAVLYIAGGFPFEFRIFYEIVPAALLLCFVPSRDL